MLYGYPKLTLQFVRRGKRPRTGAAVLEKKSWKTGGRDPAAGSTWQHGEVYPVEQVREPVDGSVGRNWDPGVNPRKPSRLIFDTTERRPLNHGPKRKEQHCEPPHKVPPETSSTTSMRWCVCRRSAQDVTWEENRDARGSVNV